MSSGPWTEHDKRHPVHIGRCPPPAPTLYANSPGYWRNRQHKRSWRRKNAHAPLRTVARRIDAPRFPQVRSSLFVGSRGGHPPRRGATDGQTLDLRKETRPDCSVERPFWARTRPKYLLSGLLRCGACGGSYTKISANLFGCAIARNKGTCDNRVNIRRETIETIVLDGLKHRLMDPDLFKIFAEEFTREFNRLRATADGRIEQAKTELAGIGRRLKNIVEAIADGVPARTLKEQLLALEARQDELRELLAKPPEPDLPFIHPQLPELYRRKVATLHEALSDEANRAEAMEMVRSLIDAIVLVPDEGSLRVEVRGELAAILSLAMGSKKPGLGDRAKAEQIKVVAGVGFEPTTFRL
jgi:site-specific DNA recombinase